MTDERPDRTDDRAVRADPHGVSRIRARQRGNRIIKRQQRQLGGMIVQSLPEQHPSGQNGAAGKLPVFRDIFESYGGAEINGKRRKGTVQQGGGSGKPVGADR